VVQGREGRRALCPLVVEQTRDAALQTARRLFPTLREPLLQAIRRADPTDRGVVKGAARNTISAGEGDLT
jgi:hypothetical protein